MNHFSMHRPLSWTNGCHIRNANPSKYITKRNAAALRLLIFPENSSANQTWRTMKNDFRNLWLGYAAFHRSRLLLDIDLYLQENLNVLTLRLADYNIGKENLRNTYLMRCTAPSVVFSFLDIIIPHFSVNVNTFFWKKFKKYI